MAARARLHTIYDHLDFPDYEYHKYPRMLFHPDAKQLSPQTHREGIIVNSEEEEAAVLASWKPAPPTEAPVKAAKAS